MGMEVDLLVSHARKSDTEKTSPMAWIGCEGELLSKHATLGQG
jgi:hypothetical protein